MARHLLTYPNPILTTPTNKVSEITSDILALIDDMVRVMRESQGVGLAAPQIGESLKIVVLEHIPGPKDDPTDAVPLQVLINPKIISRSQETDTLEEGCLSLPGIDVPVERSKRVKVRALTPIGATVQFPANGFHARIIQHELDHLDGKLITDYSPNKAELLSRYASSSASDEHAVL